MNKRNSALFPAIQCNQVSASCWWHFSSHLLFVDKSAPKARQNSAGTTRGSHSLRHNCPPSCPCPIASSALLECQMSSNMHPKALLLSSMICLIHPDPFTKTSSHAQLGAMQFACMEGSTKQLGNEAITAGRQALWARAKSFFSFILHIDQPQHGRTWSPQVIRQPSPCPRNFLKLLSRLQQPGTIRTKTWHSAISDLTNADVFGVRDPTSNSSVRFGADRPTSHILGSFNVFLWEGDLGRQHKFLYNSTDSITFGIAGISADIMNRHLVRDPLGHNKEHQRNLCSVHSTRAWHLEFWTWGPRLGGPATYM